MKYYHKSNPINRDSILLNGLIPSIGDSYKLHYQEYINEADIKPAIFACDNKDYNSTWDDDIWEISINNTITWYKDEFCYEGCFITYEKIPSYCIKLIYKGTGKSE